MPVDGARVSMPMGWSRLLQRWPSEDSLYAGWLVGRWPLGPPRTPPLGGAWLRVGLFSSPPIHCTQRYLQPSFVEPMCVHVSGHCAPQPRFSSAIVWGAYDIWMFRGCRAWSQWGVVHRFHVRLACRKFWFSVRCTGPLTPGAAALAGAAGAGGGPRQTSGRHRGGGGGPQSA
jgi:hypothetical protein